MKLRARVAVLAGLSAIILLAGAAWSMRDVLGPDPRYESVASVEHTATFRNSVLLARAERLPVAVSYLRNGFEYQHNGSVCGPTSAADLLHSIGRKENQEDVIAAAGLHPVFGLIIPGLTLDEEASLLRRVSGSQVTLERGLDLREFRQVLASANDPRLRIIINFHRGPMFGRGSGHFSPVLAYRPDRDLVLVGDVNRNYGLYLVTGSRLFDAMNTIDSITGKKRGLLVVALRAQ